MSRKFLDDLGVDPKSYEVMIDQRKLEHTVLAVKKRGVLM